MQPPAKTPGQPDDQQDTSARPDREKLVEDIEHEKHDDRRRSSESSSVEREQASDNSTEPTIPGYVERGVKRSTRD
ncbi:MAG: hypothetical protein ABI905_06590 [Betaproteobacteria bacterium]